MGKSTLKNRFFSKRFKIKQTLRRLERNSRCNLISGLRFQREKSSVQVNPKADFVTLKPSLFVSLSSEARPRIG